MVFLEGIGRISVLLKYGGGSILLGSGGLLIFSKSNCAVVRQDLEDIR